MVLMRRKDKRKENADDELAVASDTMIAANKGVRSMQAGISGRFAADMRVNVGGYGRPDQTWGVDHPWHTTREDLASSLNARDHMEDGHLVAEEKQQKPKGHGMSRAALKKKKAKMKKQGREGVPVQSKTPSKQSKEQTEVELSPALETKEVDEKPTISMSKDKKRKQEPEQEDVKPSTSVPKDKKQKLEVENAPSKPKKEDVASKPAKEDAPEQEAKLSRKQRKELKEKEDANAKLEEQKTRAGVAAAYEEQTGDEIETPSGLVLQDKEVGDGPVAKIGELLTVRYRGSLGKGGLVFGKGMLSITFGSGSVIAGWEEGLGTMRAGGSRLLTIPPSLAYGESGKGEKIPPNSTLFFEVELVRIGKRKRGEVEKDDMPLPRDFQRKKVKQSEGKKGPKGKKNQKKR